MNAAFGIRVRSGKRVGKRGEWAAIEGGNDLEMEIERRVNVWNDTIFERRYDFELRIAQGFDTRLDLLANFFDVSDFIRGIRLSLHVLL